MGNNGMMDFIQQALADPQMVTKLQDVISMFATSNPQEPTTQQQYAPPDQQMPPPQSYQSPPNYQTPPASTGYPSAYPDFIKPPAQQEQFRTDATSEPLQNFTEPNSSNQQDNRMTHLNTILKRLPENNPQRINLLTSIRPFLNTKRSSTLDKAIRMLQDTNMANMFKGR